MAITTKDAVGTQARPASLASLPYGRRGRRPSSVTRRRDIERGARLRVAATCLSLLVGAGGLTVLGIRHMLLARLDDRVTETLGHETDEVRQLRRAGVDPLTGRPLASVGRLLDLAFERNVPNTDEGFVAFVGADVHRTALGRFPTEVIPPAAEARWAAIGTDRAGPIDSAGSFATPAGEARYRALRLDVGGESGVFVVAILPSTERRDISAAVWSGAGIVVVVSFLVSLGVWSMAGRILPPLRKPAPPAVSIVATDPGPRVRARGVGEAVEMARRFDAAPDSARDIHRGNLDFLYSAGHELRAPLTVVRGHLEVMGEDDLAATVPLVLEELGRMGRMVDDLVALAGVGTPGFLDLRPVELATLSDDILARVAVTAERRWEVDERGTGTAVLDRDRVLQAVLDLADNAVRHTLPGQAIGVGVARSGGEVRLWVRDTGPGVAAGDRERIFERFVRGEGAAGRYRGSGLGLALVRSVAEAHGGSVAVAPGAGPGATFTVRLPEQAGPSEAGADGADPRR